MIFQDLKTVFFPRFQSLIGLDLGDKTLGIAICDPSQTFVRPLMVHTRGKFSKDVTFLKALIKAENCGGVILGLPLNMDGTEGVATQKVRTFAFNLSQHIDLPICFFDERLSTVAVEREMIAQDVSRGKRKLRIDAEAAAYILEGALAVYHAKRDLLT